MSYAGDAPAAQRHARKSHAGEQAHSATPPIEDRQVSATRIDPRLIQAYRETEYRVHGGGGFVLRIDQPSAALADAHAVHGVACSAFITACNPRSKDVGAAANARLHAALRQALQRRGLSFWEGTGQHPVDDWPGEPSHLVFGLTLDAARAMGRALKQNACVWSGPDAVPRLVLLR